LLFAVMTTLLEMKCEACRKDAPLATADEIAVWQVQIPDWEIMERDGIRMLRRAFEFRNFAEALAFTDRIGAIAESQGHHPALLTEWGRVTVQWWTHKIRGLHANDFVMAARTDRLAEEQGCNR
jgi:4a-hydroxytetrahydrobiopterin dehydratase